MVGYQFLHYDASCRTLGRMPAPLAEQALYINMLYSPSIIPICAIGGMRAAKATAAHADAPQASRCWQAFRQSCKKKRRREGRHDMPLMHYAYPHSAATSVSHSYAYHLYLNSCTFSRCTYTRRGRWRARRGQTRQRRGGRWRHAQRQPGVSAVWLCNTKLSGRKYRSYAALPCLLVILRDAVPAYRGLSSDSQRDMTLTALYVILLAVLTTSALFSTCTKMSAISPLHRTCLLFHASSGLPFYIAHGCRHGGFKGCAAFLDYRARSPHSNGIAAPGLDALAFVTVTGRRLRGFRQLVHF